ncbi:hypothetical protein AB0J90_13570 [Micromonospora sp. NPDC049523]|uniref:hypothetical protein n=1 Tax=Micromonospora sp. NPDC049523 TaxID=3155921 RepID=UPI0034333C34
MGPRTVKLLLVGFLAVVSVAASATPASAGPRGYHPEPWRTWVQQEWTSEAGRYCSFPLGVRVVSQDVRVRVAARYPDGAVRREEFTGPLLVDFVDVHSGRAVRRDAGGSGAAEYRPDGTWIRYTILGPAGFGFRPGDHYPRGYYILDGLHTITFEPDGTRKMAIAVGRQDNVCRALGDPS